jgi:hypothetical protein
VGTPDWALQVASLRNMRGNRGKWLSMDVGMGGRCLLQLHQGVNALGRYLQRGEERRREMQFMISSSVESQRLCVQ